MKKLCFILLISLTTLIVKGQTGSTEGYLMEGRNRRMRGPKKKDIDAIDGKMINLLQKDGRLSNIEIAKEPAISEATVRTRLKRLLGEEYIQIVAVSDPFKLGFEMAGDFTAVQNKLKNKFWTSKINKL